MHNPNVEVRKSVDVDCFKRLIAVFFIKLINVPHVSGRVFS